MSIKKSGIFIVVMTLLLLSQVVSHASAANGKQVSPEMAAKKEMVRKQQDQRITNEKRKAAAEALKAERLRVHNAKQAVKQSNP